MAHTPKFNTNGVERTELSKLKIGDYIWGTIWKKDDENKLEVSFNENDPKYESGWTKVTEDCWFKFKKGSIFANTFYNSIRGTGLLYTGGLKPIRFLVNSDGVNSYNLRFLTFEEAESIKTINDTLLLSPHDNIFKYWYYNINPETTRGGIIIQESIFTVNGMDWDGSIRIYRGESDTVFTHDGGYGQQAIILVHDYVDNPNSENIYY